MKHEGARQNAFKCHNVFLYSHGVYVVLYNNENTIVQQHRSNFCAEITTILIHNTT